MADPASGLALVWCFGETARIEQLDVRGTAPAIQSVHEPPECRNPGQAGAPLHSVPRAVSIDVGESGRRVQTEGEPLLLLPGREDEVHDQVLSEAVADGVQSIVNVGCGTDTSVHRFSHLFKHRDVRVLECDRAEAIRAKQRIVRRWQHSQHIEYLQIDLNADTWPEAAWLEKQPGRTLVLMEGVSPYIDDVSFGRFLSLLASTLAAGSQVAYDFKIQGPTTTSAGKDELSDRSVADSKRRRSSLS